MQRPMATLGLTFFISLIIASFLDVKMAAVLAALGLVFFITGLFIKSIRKNARIMTVLLATMSAFSMYSVKEALTYRPLQKYNGKTVHLRLETIDLVQDNNSVTVRVLEGGLPKNTRLTFWISGLEIYPNPYDILEGDFKLSTPKDSKNGRIRGYSKAHRTYLNTYSAQYQEKDIELYSPKSRPFMYNILNSRRVACNTVLSQPKMDDVAGLMVGTAFGFKDNISSSIKYNFRTIGVSHLLAVSGLHVSLLSQALLTILLRCKIPRRVSLGISCAGILFFMALTGFSPSVLRAGIMCLIFLAGQIIGREPDSLNSLGFSVFAITAINPYAVNDVGLLLSFSATFGLVVLLPVLNQAVTNRIKINGRFAKLIKYPVKSLCLTISATLPTIPIILFSFGQISLISPIANILMVFPASIVMITTCIAVPLSSAGLLRFLAAGTIWVGKWVARYLVFIADWLASLPMASICSKQTFLLLLIPASIVLMILGGFWFGRHGVRMAALWSAVSLMCGVLTSGLLMHGVTSISVLNAGNSSAILLERSGKTGVIWMGDDTAVTSTVYELERRNVRVIDFLMIPGLDDECAFCPMVLTNKIKVNCLISGPPGNYTNTVDSLVVNGRLSWQHGIIGFWNDCTAELDNKWLRIKIGQTVLLISPYNADVNDISIKQRKANLTVFTGSPPRHISALTTQAAVLSCMDNSLDKSLKAIPRSSYSLYNTAIDNVLILTRGRGDITYKGGSLDAAN